MPERSTDVYQLLSVALSMELEDQEIYATYAQGAAGPGLARLLTTMVEVKREHERRLRELELYEPLPELFVPRAEGARRATDYVSAAAFDPRMPYAELLRSAVERESSTAELYADLRDRARHEDVRILLSRLCDEERKLQRWAQDQLELLQLGSL